MKGVVLLSGGLDSSVLLTKLVKEGDNCYPLSIDYGQRHVREVEAAAAICGILGVDHKWQCLDLSNLKELLRSALVGSKGVIPHGHYEAETQKATVVPNRNMILLSIAAGYASSISGEFVAYAAHSNDRAIYADCRPEFVKSVTETISLGTDNQIHLIEPFVDMTKAEIVKLGIQLGAPLYLTHSCYEGSERPCLQCGTCLERTEAFYLNNTSDPALSLEEWGQALKYLRQHTK